MADKLQLAAIKYTADLWPNKGSWRQSCCMCTEQTLRLSWFIRDAVDLRGEWVGFGHLLFDDPLSPELWYQDPVQVAAKVVRGKEQSHQGGRRPV